MIRTDFVNPTVRIEIKGRSIVAHDPNDGSTCTITETADWDQLDNIVLKRLDQIRAEYNPPGSLLNASRAEEVVSEIYAAGMTALMFLIGAPRAARKADIVSFFRTRIDNVRDPALLPIIDLVSDSSRHFPVEILPVVGRFDEAGSGDQATAGRARTMPGYTAVIRRTPLHGDGVQSGAAIFPKVPVPMRLFRHDELPGSRREIRELESFEREGRLKVICVYPPRGHHSAQGAAAKELTQVVSGPYKAQPAESIPGHICHFSCHLVDDKRRQALVMLPNGWFPRPEKYYLDLLPAAVGDVPAVPEDVAVVFLGTCRSGVPGSMRASAVDVFRFYQPRALIGTLADVPDQTAAEFCIAFYREFTDGTCVGAAIHQARVKLLQRYLNPFGLLFTSYFGEDFHATVRQDRRADFIPAEGSLLTAFPR